MGVARAAGYHEGMADISAKRRWFQFSLRTLLAVASDYVG